MAELEMNDPALKDKIDLPGVYMIITKKYLKQQIGTDYDAEYERLRSIDYEGEDISFKITDYSPHTPLTALK